MNQNYEIYRDYEKNIPSEDKARLEGYLYGREEADKLKKVLKKESERNQ